jgi:ABC-type sugar transport system substrate-binding protein
LVSFLFATAGVASNNDEMALGTLQAIEAAAKLGQIPHQGAETDPELA